MNRFTVHTVEQGHTHVHTVNADTVAGEDGVLTFRSAGQVVGEFPTTSIRMLLRAEARHVA